MICNRKRNRCNRRVVTAVGDVRGTFSTTYGGSKGPVTAVTGKGNRGGRKAFKPPVRPGITLPKKENLGGLPSILRLQWLQWLHNTLTGLSRATYPRFIRWRKWLHSGYNGYTPERPAPLEDRCRVPGFAALVAHPRSSPRRLPALALRRPYLRPAPGEAPTGPLTRPGGPVSQGTRTRIAGRDRLPALANKALCTGVRRSLQAKLGRSSKPAVRKHSFFDRGGNSRPPGPIGF